MGLAILIMLFAVIYEILEFTAFDGKYTKIAIALGISVIIAVSRGVTIIMSFFLALAGGSVVLATLVAIGIGISFFIVATFYKGKMHVFKAKGKAADAKAGYVRAAGAIGGLTDIDSASKKLSR